MTIYPRTYAQATAMGDHLNEHDWDAVVAAYNGTTVTGVRAYPFDYLIRFNGDDYEAIDSAHNIVYGGEDDAGSVDGATLAAVWQACINSCRTRTAILGATSLYGPGYIVLKGDLTLAAPIDMTECKGFVTEHVGGTLTIEYSGTAGSKLFDLTGAYHCSFVGFHIYVSETYTPTCLFLLARTYAEGSFASPSAGSHFFNNCEIQDYASPDSNGHHTTIYSYASETNYYCKTDIYVKCSAFVITTQNIWSLESTYKTIATGPQSSLQTIFDGGGIFNYYTENVGGLSSKIIMDGGGNHVFTNSFFGSWYSYLFEVDNTYSGVWGVWFNNNRLEGKLLKCTVADAYITISDFKFENSWFDYGDKSDYAGFVDSSPGTYWVDANYENNAFNGWVFKGCSWSIGETYTCDFWLTSDPIIDFTSYGEEEPVFQAAVLYRGYIIMHEQDNYVVASEVDPVNKTFLEEAESTVLFPPASYLLYGGESTTGTTHTTIGTTYTEFSSYMRTNVDFTYYRPTEMRLVIIAQGSEAGNGKGIRIGLGTAECEHTWDGNAVERAYTAWADLTTAGLSAETEMSFQGKGSSASEDLTVFRVELQFR